MAADYPKDTEPSELLQKFHQRALPTTDERVSMHQQIVARWKDSSLSTIPSKDLLKSEIDESDLSNVLWVGSHFNQPFLYEEDVLSSKRIDSERTLWLYDPKRCWVDVLVRRVYLGGAYNRRHCKSDHELIALCPKKAFGVTLQMHFNEKSDDVDRFALLKRLRKQSLSDPQCLVPTYLVAAPVSLLWEIASRSQKQKKTRKRDRSQSDSPSFISNENVLKRRIKHSVRWLDSIPSQDCCEMAARLLQQWSLRAAELLQLSAKKNQDEEEEEKETMMMTTSSEERERE